MNEKKSSKLPPIQSLFQDSWELFEKTWFSYLKLVGFAIAYIFLALLIGILISLPISFVVVGTHFQIFRHMTPFHIADLVLIILWFILFFLSILAIDVIFPIVSISIFQGKQGIPVLDLIKRSKTFFWTLFFTLLLSGLIILGGTIILVIPGLLFAFFFTFISYEVVIDKQSVRSALRRSYFMVKSFFWQILGRLLLLEAGIIVISTILDRLEGAAALLSLVQFLFTLFVSWYARGYTYLLYKQLRERTAFPEHISIKWVWIVSVIGWVIILLLLVGVGMGMMYVPGMQYTRHLPPINMHRAIPNGAA
jgi:hypothetical protein